MKEDNANKDQYDDIIHLQHYVSMTHPPMSLYNRAAQFSPFAALTGHDGAIRETARLTDQRRELDEAQKAILNEKITVIKAQLSRQEVVEFVFFQPDETKAGGAYVSVSGIVRKIDGYERSVIMQDGTRIPIAEIVNITGEMVQVVDDYCAYGLGTCL